MTILTITPKTELLAAGTGRITTGGSTVELAMSIVTFTDHTIAASQTSEVSYFDARVVDGARYPSLAAIWENDEDDAAFANI
jgi:hypothetical protein